MQANDHKAMILMLTLFATRDEQFCGTVLELQFSKHLKKYKSKK
jgi:hypothetical protein